jgi:NitT/TauT family transport system substrate-binding protein
MTSRLIVVNTAGLERRRDTLRRFMLGYHETLDWLYSDPAAITAYAAWSGLAEAIARQAPKFMSRRNMEPTRVSGLDGIMVDAVKFKYIAAPLTQAQLAELFQVDAVR